MSDIHNNMKKTKTLLAGFTMVELLVTIALAAIVTSMAVPSFRDFSLNNRLTTQNNEFVSSLNLSRSEAIKRNASVTVCSSNDQATCTGSSWQSGWVVRVTSSGELLRAYNALSGSTTLVNAGNITSIQYDASGFLNGGASQSFLFCDNRTAESGRQIVISGTGRPNNTSPFPVCS